MNERTRYARPESEGRCHCTELRKASRRISQLYDAALAPSGLKTTQRAILAEIGRSEPATVGSLADSGPGTLRAAILTATHQAIDHTLAALAAA